MCDKPSQPAQQHCWATSCAKNVARITGPLTVKNTITKLKTKAENNSGLKGLSCAVFFLLFNNYDFPCVQSNI